MPWIERYEMPKGERQLEFWKQYRGGQSSTYVNVPADWSDEQIKEELEDWCAFQYHNYHVSYGWNDFENRGDRTSNKDIRW